MNTTIYIISGMTCEGCVTRVKATLNTFADNVEVTLNPPQVNLNNCNATLETLTNRHHQSISSVFVIATSNSDHFEAELAIKPLRVAGDEVPPTDVA